MLTGNEFQTREAHRNPDKFLISSFSGFFDTNRQTD